MTRLQKTLIAVLLIQVALGAIVFWPESDIAESGEPLLDGAGTSRIDRLEIASEDGEIIKLAVDPITNRWVHAPSGYAANEQAIAELIGGLQQIETGRLVTQTPASHGRLLVADSQFDQKITIWAGAVKQELLVGTAPNARSVHVRIPNQDEVWLTAAITSQDVTPAIRNWVDTLYYSMDRTDILNLTVENGSGTYEFVQSRPAGEDENGNFVAAEWEQVGFPEDALFDVAAFNTLLSRATSVRFLEPL
ncbi:MAG: DUF4340 domain-containing protein, partial [Chloroflexota bacterium]